MKTTTLQTPRTRLLAIMLLLAVLLLPAAPALAETDAGYDVRFKGVINVVPETDSGSWTIAGHEVTVGSATQVLLTKGEAATAGMWAYVTARKLTGDNLLAQRIVVMPPEVRLKGPLTEKGEPVDGVAEWTIAGQTILFTADTVVSQRSGPVEAGQWVEVYAVEEPAGTLTAVRVRGTETTQVVEVFGAIQSYGEDQWVLSGIPVAATSDTLILGEPEVQLLAHAAADLTDADTLSARVFNVAWQEPNNRLQRHPIQLTGVIEELPTTSDLLGLWQVAGKTVDVLPSTQIFQVKGAVEVGARVHITGWEEADRIVATQITVLASPSGSGRTFCFHGTIEALPGSGLLGTWTIAGQQVQVTRQTRIYGEQFVRLGAPVEAGGLQYQNGIRLTTWLRVRDMSGPGLQPADTVQSTFEAIEDRTPDR